MCYEFFNRDTYEHHLTQAKKAAEVVFAKLEYYLNNQEVPFAESEIYRLDKLYQDKQRTVAYYKDCLKLGKDVIMENFWKYGGFK